VGADPADLLRQRGIQVTAQRLAVLRAVAGEPHVTADAVAEVVRTEIGAISLQSVYDALNVLVSEGLIRRIQPAGSPARFEDRVGDNHHHLICRICGRVVDVDCVVGKAPCLSAHDDNGYQIDEAEVAYWGRCPDCQVRSKAPASAEASARRPSRARKQVRLTASAEAAAVEKPNTTRSRQRTPKRIARKK
jgi:Fur family transcriptional regulator, stress-responsive regulator